MIRKLISFFLKPFKKDMSGVVSKLEWILFVNHLNLFMQEFALVTKTACAIQMEVVAVLLLLISLHVIQFFLSFLLLLLLQWLECWHLWLRVLLAEFLVLSVEFLPSVVFSGFLFIIAVQVAVVARFLKVVFPFIRAIILKCGMWGLTWYAFFQPQMQSNLEVIVFSYTYFGRI